MNSSLNNFCLGTQTIGKKGTCRLLISFPKYLKRKGEVAQTWSSVNDHSCPVKGLVHPCKAFKHMRLSVILGEIDLRFLSPVQGHASALTWRICHALEDGIGDSPFLLTRPFFLTLTPIVTPEKVSPSL